MPESTPIILPTIEGYDRWAPIYDGEGNPLIALETPEVARLLGDVRGLTVADVGCGTGRHALQLARQGAKVFALDFSDGMLARAKAKLLNESITFLRHDLTQPLLPFPDGTVDRIVCCLVLDHLKNLSATMREFRRVCSTDGYAVVSVMHPAMMLRGVQARFVDEVTGLEMRPESHPHQVSDYVMAAVKAGLRISHLSEHAFGPELADRVPRAQRYVGWPMLLMMKLQR
jgi:ubiquinone/menaquinone biosynthesis C-methylase UbiE